MNEEIKDYAKKRGVKLWQIAAKLGCNDGNFSRKLRFEISSSEKEKIFSIIDRLTDKETDFYHKKDKEVLEMYFNQMNGDMKKVLIACAEQILLGEEK